MTILRVPRHVRHKQRIDKPGIYNVDRRFYHTDPVVEPSLSASIAKLLLEAPPAIARSRHPRFNPELVQETSEAAEIGTICHAMLTGDTERIRVLPYADYRGETASRLRKEARKEGRIPILKGKLEMIQRGVECLDMELQQMGMRSEIDPSHAVAEPTIIWREAGSFWCRSRLDWLSREVRDPMTVYDLKTTARTVPQSSEDLGRMIYNDGWDIQAAAYASAVKHLTGVSRVNVTFLILSLGDVPTVTVADVGTMLREIGHRRWSTACDLWVRSKSQAQWPASARKRIPAEPPGYLEMRWLGEVSRDNWHRTQQPEDDD